MTGVLPIALSRACRLNEYFMHKNKTYVGILRLHKEVPNSELNKAISKFIGKITQLPPVRSSVKRQEREREITSFKILERKDRDVLFETEVQAGTYIRKLCDDMGKLIGGAHMLELRRTKAGIFDELKSIKLYDFDKALDSLAEGDETPLRNILIPGEIVSTLMSSIDLNEPGLIKKLLQGKPIMKSDLKLPKTEEFCIFNKDQLIGIYKKASEGDIIARAEIVFN